MKYSFELIKIAFFSSFLFASCTCTEQHDPTAHRQRVEKESQIANAPVAKLTPEGTLPAATGGEAAASGSPIDAKYNSLCASCHGAAGDANSPVAAAMNPKPRNFTDAAWQGKVDDAHIAKVIKEGGASVGLSASMAAWGAMLSDDEIKQMVQKVRSFKK